MIIIRILAGIIIILTGVTLSGVFHGYSLPREYQEAWLAVAMAGWGGVAGATFHRRS